MHLALDRSQKQLLTLAVAGLRPRAEEACGDFLRRLYAIDPELRSRFEQQPQPGQARGLLLEVEQAVSALDDAPALALQVAGLAGRFAGQGAQPEHCEAVGACLLATLRNLLTDLWTPEMEDAWLDFYAEMSSRVEAAALPARS